MAQWIAHQTSNLGVAGSSPAWSIFKISIMMLFFSKKRNYNLKGLMQIFLSHARLARIEVKIDSTEIPLVVRAKEMK